MKNPTPRQQATHGLRVHAKTDAVLEAIGWAIVDLSDRVAALTPPATADGPEPDPVETARHLRAAAVDAAAERLARHMAPNVTTRGFDALTGLEQEALLAAVRPLAEAALGVPPEGTA